MEEIAPLLIVAMYLGFIAYEALLPRRKLAPVRRWRSKGVLFFVVTAVVSTVLPLLYGDFVARHALFDLSGLGTVAGALVGYALYQLAAYWWHRLMHTSSFLWRWAHQMHHSAERVDMWGAMYFHPFDIAGFTLVGSLVYSLVLGLSPAAVALANVIGLCNSFLQHANIRTPRWLGYLVQRPEAHGIHHQRGVHGYNYADLPVWDILFGTFRNPAVWNEQGGFYDGGSARVGAMLIGRDISTPESNPMSARPALAPEPGYNSTPVAA
jgi:sterol desaturase/sphingolipid hydroxylase (fatty acid hydroxylase superfamily)